VIDWLTCLADDCPELGGERPPGFLSASEREVWPGLRFPKRRREWLLGRWTAKCLLQRCHPAYRSLPLQAITVGNDADGAPYLSVEGEGPLAMSLSISHRDDRAFCALSSTLPPFVGADLERVEPRDPAFAHDFFTHGEDARVWACTPSQRDTLITVVWSAKEAMLKALHHGLRVDTRSVEILHAAGLEEGNVVARPPSGAVEPDEFRSKPQLPEVTWHELRVQCAPELWPARAPAVVGAWWRPWGTYVLTVASVSEGRIRTIGHM
jgi:4'-phosphopantetheinyl transferase